MSARAWLSPVRPDGLVNLNLGDALLATSLYPGEAERIVELINRPDPEWVTHLKVVDIHPGDILFVHYAERISPEIVEDIRNTLGKVSGLEQVVVMSDGATLGVLRPAPVSP